MAGRVSHLEALAESERWTNVPQSAHLEDGKVLVRTWPESDLWHVTHYGFKHTNGSYCGVRAPLGNWECMIRFSGTWQHLYDQAGAMVTPVAPMKGEVSWIKCGVEFVDGKQQASVVATRSGFSDWSTMPLSTNPKWFTLRLQKKDDALFVHFKTGEEEDGEVADGGGEGGGGKYNSGGWQMLRLTPIPPEWGPLLVGPMACSPSTEEGGVAVTFTEFSITPLLTRPSRAPIPTSTSTSTSASTSASTSSSTSSSASASTSGIDPARLHAGVVHRSALPSEWSTPVPGEPRRGPSVSIMEGSRRVFDDDAAAAATSKKAGGGGDGGEEAGVGADEVATAAALASMHLDATGSATRSGGVDDDDRVILDIVRKERGGELSEEAAYRLAGGLGIDLARGAREARVDNERAAMELLDAVAAETKPKEEDV